MELQDGITITKSIIDRPITACKRAVSRRQIYLGLHVEKAETDDYKHANGLQ